MPSPLSSVLFRLSQPAWRWVRSTARLQQPSRLVGLTTGLTIFLFAPSLWITWDLNRSFNQILAKEFKLKQLSDQATYLDEVLTMSAQMNAATGDRQWEERYRRFEPQLESVLQLSIIRSILSIATCPTWKSMLRVY